MAGKGVVLFVPQIPSIYGVPATTLGARLTGIPRVDQGSSLLWCSEHGM